MPGPANASCSLSSWSSATATVPGTTLRVGEPNQPLPIVRYSGRCAMSASAPANYVTDDSPASEAAFHARFYVFTGASGAPVTIFRARNSAGVAMVTIRYTGSAFEFATRSAYSSSQAVQTGHWYAIQLDWTAGNAMSATVKGAGLSALAVVTTSPAQAGDRIESAQLGWIEGAATGSLAFDAYEARRRVAPPRLCRGNADGNRVRDAHDQGSDRREFLERVIARGQPDCNEDGRVDSGDEVCVRNIVEAGQGDCDDFPEL